MKTPVIIGDLTAKCNFVKELFLTYLVAGKLILELKAIDHILPIHEAQIISYLKATGLHAGLLINFNVQILKDGGIKRIIRSG